MNLIKSSVWGRLGLVLAFLLSAVAQQALALDAFDETAAFANPTSGRTLTGWVFLDSSGKLKIKDRFDDVRAFKNGLCAVRLKGKWGYIDRSGKLVIMPRFDWAWDFSEGLAAVEIKNKIGFIDKGGVLKIPARFDSYRSLHPWPYTCSFSPGFSNGLAACALNKKFGYIDRSGKFLIAPKFDFAYDFVRGKQEAPALAKVYLNRKSALINKNGSFVSELFSCKSEQGSGADKKQERIATEPLKFSESYCIIDSKGKMGLLNSYGKLVLKPVYSRLLPMQEGLIAAQEKEDGKWIFIDAYGKKQIDADLVVYSGFSEGLSVAAPLTGFAEFPKSKFGYMNKKGEFLIAPGFSFPEPFHGDLAVAYEGDADSEMKAGYINKDGDWVIKPQFNDARPFKDGLAFVGSNASWRLIRKDGSYASQDIYVSIDNESEGLRAVVILSPGSGRK